MAQIKPQPRKSVFSSDAHPLKNQPQAPHSTPETSTEATEAKTTTPKAKSSTTAQTPQEATPKVKASFYGDSATIDRMREAFTRNKIDEDYESFSDFIIQAALKETQRLEKKYNNGQPYQGIKRLSVGRPISS